MYQHQVFCFVFCLHKNFKSKNYSTSGEKCTLLISYFTNSIAVPNKWQCGWENCTSSERIPLVRFFLIGNVEVSHVSQQPLLKTLLAPGATDAPATGTRHPGGTGYSRWHFCLYSQQSRPSFRKLYPMIESPCCQLQTPLRELFLAPY